MSTLDFIARALIWAFVIGSISIGAIALFHAIATHNHDDNDQ